MHPSDKLQRSCCDNFSSVESILWLLLTVQCWHHDWMDIVAIITVLHWILRCVVIGNSHDLHVPRRSPSRQPVVWRNLDHNTPNGDAMGMYMSMSLVPILYQSIATVLNHQPLKYIALVSATIPMVVWHNVVDPIRQIQSQMYPLMWLIFFVVTGMTIYMFMTMPSSSTGRHYETAVSIVIFTCSWSYGLSALGPHQYTTLQRVMTMGEWLVISNLLAFVFTQWMIALLYLYVDDTIRTSNLEQHNETLYAYTAVSGVFGCIFACATVHGIFQSTWNKLLPTMNEQRRSIVIVLFRAAYLVTVTLGTVELCFWLDPNVQYPFPKCLWWIFGDFLWNVEEAPLSQPTFIMLRSWFPSASTGINHISKVPRIAWLFYWIATMTVAIPLAPSTGNINPVIARKWFHLVSIVLFLPTTVLAPQLQSLSYAIAICVLLIIESLRHDILWLNHFYMTYLDSNKDETHDATIISHIALIAGCAIPLWVAQYFSYYSDNAAVMTDTLEFPSKFNTLSLLLGLWGVWVLGIGDAMGAMIGKHYGRIKWGYNHRTIEGSVAMFVSLCVACALTTMYSATTKAKTFDQTAFLTRLVWLWLPAVVFVTLLEAHTMQIDNIVLPLAGTAMIFLCYESLT
jgi:dolichol kinase